MAPEEDVLRKELESLRRRLEEMENRRKAETEELRKGIEALEAKIGVKPKAALSDPLEWEALARVGKPKPDRPVERKPQAVSVPPPLPERMPVKPAEIRESRDEGFEFRLGRVWLVRLGIVLLVTGLVLLGNYAYKNWIREMPAAVRLLGLYLCSGVLVETGRRLAARETMRRPGEVILAGGLAFFYYCTFAAHHVERLRVIGSPVLAAVLLFGAAALIAVVSWKRNSKATAVLGVLLASYSTMLQPVGWLSCVSSTLLAGAGVFLMSRPGWSGPGIAAMVSTYAAFIGWQLMGASGGSVKEPALMWFLPPVWAMFSLPALSDRFRESMGDRAKAWFTAGNNAAFFVLFSVLWFVRHEEHGYWMVPAVFGTVLVALGMLGRSRSNPAGGVNVSQGIGLVTLALAIRLDGYHLALAFAAESLALAFAFRRFRGKSELVFSCLAALGAMLMTVGGRIRLLPEMAEVPLWSAGLAAVLVAGTSGVLKWTEKSTGERSFSAVLVHLIAMIAAVFGWAWWLPQPWPVIALMALSVAASSAAVFSPKGWSVDDYPIGALLAAFAAAAAAFLATEPWAVHVAGALAIGSLLLWHREEKQGRIGKEAVDAILWIFALLAAGVFWLGVEKSGLPEGWNLVLRGVIGVAMALLASFVQSGPLLVAGTLLTASGLTASLHGGQLPWTWACVTACGLANTAMAGFFRRDGGIGKEHRVVAMTISRVAAFSAVCAFWYAWKPGHFGDGLAVTAIALSVILLVLRRALLPEVWLLVILAAGWLVVKCAVNSWLPVEPSWRGGWVALSAFLMLVVAGSKRNESPALPVLVAWLAVAVISLWATEMLVWRHGWYGAAVLWTVLGFASVCGGLVSRIAALRQAGLVLLGMALLKVFMVDVWDFNAFMRVVAFIVLGAALVLLGLFYNRFAQVMKKLIEEAPVAAPEEPERDP